jgi:outer membrane protein
MKKILTITIFNLIALTGRGQIKEWSLRECIEQALQQNISLNQAALNNTQNLINLKQAKANLIPSLNITDAQGLSHGRSIDPFSNQFVNQGINSNNFTTTSSITIFGGLLNLNTLKQNKLNYQAGNLDMEKAKNDLSLNVAMAYLQVLFSYEQLDISRKQIESSKEQLRKVEEYVNVGKLSISNLYQVRAQLSSDILAVTNAENQLMLSKLSLMQLMEIPSTDDFRIQRPDINPSPPKNYSKEEVYQKAIETQPQVNSAAIKTQSAYTAMQMAKSYLYPKLTISGSIRTGYSSARKVVSYQQDYHEQQIGYLQGDPSQTVVGYVPVTSTNTSPYAYDKQFKDNIGQSVNLNLSIPIFNNRLYRSNIEKASLNHESSKLNEQLIKNQLRKAVEQAYTDMLAAESRYMASKDQVSASEQAFISVKEKFDVGLGSAIDYISEKNNYSRSLSGLIQAKYDYIFKTKVLEFYKGMPIDL